MSTNNGWVMRKIKFSEIDQRELAEQTPPPPGYTHFMAQFTNRSIGKFEQAVIIIKDPLLGNEEIKYPHGLLEYDRTIHNKKVPQYITYYNNAGDGIFRRLIEHKVEDADDAPQPGGKRKSRRTKRQITGGKRRTKKTRKRKRKNIKRK